MHVPGQKISGAIRWTDWTYARSLSCFCLVALPRNNAAHNWRAPYALPVGGLIRCNAQLLCAGVKMCNCGSLWPAGSGLNEVRKLDLDRQANFFYL